MKNEHVLLFTHLRSVEPRVDLLDRIMNRIDTEKMLVPTFRVKIRLILAIIGACAAMTFIVPLWNIFQNDMAQSGFAQFVSLLFSDLDTVVNVWQDYAFSLIESLPLLSLTAILSTVLLLLFALKYLARDMRAIVRSHSMFIKI